MHLFPTPVYLQTLAMCMPALCLLLMDWIHNFSEAVSCMMLAVGSCAFVNSGVNVTPQDMAPKYAGSLFGECTHICKTARDERCN